MHIPFNRINAVGTELGYIKQAIENMHLMGDGSFTKNCHAWLERRVGSARALLTQSCTAALEMTALLADLKPGDEVIMPSFTFVSTANAFALRGAVPVFVDIRPDTLNIDETKIESAITPRTKMIVPVHYAGVSCKMDPIMKIASDRNLLVVEDAAQGLMSTYKGRALGSMGHFSAYSFHETKNIVCGEGGALLINDAQWVEQAEIIREKGTDRSQFLRGQVNKYSWQEIGSSFLPSEINSAFLWAQLEQAEPTTRRRLHIWQRYHEGLAGLEAEGRLRRPVVPSDCNHNGHLYYLLLPDTHSRNEMLQKLNDRGISATFHYLPLHSSPAGLRYGRAHGSLEHTVRSSECLLRLPLWTNMTEDQIDHILAGIHDVITPLVSEQRQVPA